MAFLTYLFDYNGVLVDDELVHLAAFREVLRPLGVELGEQEYVSKYLGFDDVGAFRAILRDNGLAGDDARIQMLVNAKMPAYFRRAKEELRPFPGAGSLLCRLARNGAVIGIVSGALRREVELGLRVLGSEKAVAFIVSAEDTRACKPDPEGYLIGRQKLEKQMTEVGYEASPRTVAVEDSLAGVVAAIAADLPCIAVAHSYSEAELQRAGATRVVNSLADLTDEFLADLANRSYAISK